MNSNEEEVLLSSYRKAVDDPEANIPILESATVDK
jgi:hypothetical protein